MKKVFMGMFAIATMLLATSCSEDELIAQSSGNEVTVSFTANVRSDVKTKAVGDDTEGIDQLIFAVYDENGVELQALRQSTHPTEDGCTNTTAISLSDADGGKKKATINVVLVKGQTYSFAFWAQNAAYDVYSFNSETAEVSIDYTKQANTANNKNADAFFANATLTVSGSFEKDITLKRPFAQVNFLTTQTDIDKAEDAGFVPSQSSIVVKNAATSLNVLDGTVTGSTEATFNLADILLSENTKIKNGTQYVGFDATTKAFPLKDTESEANEFYYLATAYFLTTEGASVTTIDASMNVVAEDNGKMDLSVPGVNAQRNFRTNIYGNLLTSGGKFNVTVDPGFDGDYSDEYEDPTTKVVGTIAEAQALFNNTSTPVTNVTITEAPTSDATLILPDTQEDVTINFAFEEGSTPAEITIDGSSNSNANKMTVNGDAGDLVINAPNSTVTLNGNYTSVTATTAQNTLIVPKGVTIETLKLMAGNAEIYYGAVTTLQKDANYDGTITWLVDAEATVKDIENAIANGEAIKLIEDVAVESMILINKTFTIDLNGCTIIGTDNTDKSFSILDNRGNLTIKNTNTSEAKLTLKATINSGWSRYSAVVANNPGGNLTVESGVVIEHLGGTDMAYGIDNLTNGKGTSAITTINGATVKSSYTAIRQFLNGVEATNNLIVNANSIISGTKRGIWMQDPSENANTGSLTVQENANVNNVHLSVTKESTEWPIELSVAASSLGEKGITFGDYIPAGYEVVEADGVYSIKRWIIVSSADELVEALEAGKDVIFADCIKIDPANMSNAYGKTGINVKNGQDIDGGGYTLDIKGAGGTWDSGINTTGGLIKNIKVTGSFRGIFVNHNSTHAEKVILENVIIDGTTYTISCDQGNGKGLEATNCTFKGWTSYAATIGEVKFTNCTFGEGSGYAFCRPYAPTEFINCNFEAGFKVDPRAAVTFENCTLNGVAITAENLSTLVTSNIANATVK